MWVETFREDCETGKDTSGFSFLAKIQTQFRLLNVNSDFPQQRSPLMMNELAYISLVLTRFSPVKHLPLFKAPKYPFPCSHVFSPSLLCSPAPLPGKACRLSAALQHVNLGLQLPEPGWRRTSSVDHIFTSV